jgi:branched-chain amino acid transport system substrate-binding protein
LRLVQGIQDNSGGKKSNHQLKKENTMKKHNRKFFGYILMMLISVTLVAGLSGCETKKQPFKVGFVGSLTGRYSELGVAGRNAVTLAVEQINEAGGINGRRVELIVKDDKNDPEVAVQVDKELISEGVVAIIGHMTSSMSKAVVPLINEEKIVMISPTTTTDSLTGLDDYFFRTNTPDFQRVFHLVHYIFDEKGLRKLAVVYDLSNRAFSEMWYKNSKAEFESLGGLVTTPVSFSSGKDVSYPDIVKALLISNPEGILTIAGPTDTATICQELQKAGANIPVFDTGWADSLELIQHGGSAVEGIIFVVNFDEFSEHENYLEFKKQFYERFKMEPTFASVYAYDAAQLLFSALAQTEDPRDLKKAILAEPVFHALQGDISMDQYGDPRRGAFLYTVKNGEFKNLKTLE